MPDFREKPTDLMTTGVGRGGVRVSAGAAFAMPTVLADKQILTGKKMAPGTVRFPGILRVPTFAAKGVGLQGNNVDVARFHADPVPAKMVALLARRNGPGQKCMRADGFVRFPEVKFPVPRLLVDSPGPDPAGAKLRTVRRNRPILIDFFPEALFDRSVRRHAENFSTKAEVNNCNG